MEVVKEFPDIASPTKNASQRRPWVRFLARQTDTVLVSIILTIIAEIITPEGTHNYAYIFLFSCIVFIPLEAISLSMWGTTIGKSLLSTTITDSNLKFLDLKSALTRSWSVSLKGMGFGIPVIHIFTLLWSYTQLITNDITSWDKSGKYKVTHKKISRTKALVCILINIATFAMVNYADTSKLEQTTPSNRYEAHTLEELFETFSQSISKKLPLEVYDGLRLNKVYAEGKTFNYEYIYFKNDRKDFAGKITPKVISNAKSETCSVKGLKVALIKGASIRSLYYDKNGLLVYDLEVKATDCGY